MASEVDKGGMAGVVNSIRLGTEKDKKLALSDYRTKLKLQLGISKLKDAEEKKKAEALIEDKANKLQAMIAKYEKAGHKLSEFGMSPGSAKSKPTNSWIKIKAAAPAARGRSASRSPVKTAVAAAVAAAKPKPARVSGASAASKRSGGRRGSAASAASLASASAADGATSAGAATSKRKRSLSNSRGGEAAAVEGQPLKKQRSFFVAAPGQ